MMLTFLASLFAILRWHREPTPAHLLVAAATVGLTLLHRPLVLFVLVGAFAAPVIAEHGLRGLFRRHTVIFGFMGLMPMALYYGYGMLFADSLSFQAETSFRPHLLLHREFWQGWFDLALNEAGPVALTEAIACGLPVVSTPIGGIGEVIVDGQNERLRSRPSPWRDGLRDSPR